MNGAPVGAYGLRLRDLPVARSLLVPAPSWWREWRIERIAGEAPQREHSVGAQAAVLPLVPNGLLEVDRQRAAARFTMTAVPADADVAHPYLAPVAALAARWAGDIGLHAGCFLVGGSAWGVLAASGHGKSTLLATIAQMGIGIGTDDLMVVRGTTTCAGPRCIDLRSDTAASLGMGEPIGVVGARERWRIVLDGVPAEAPIAGWVLLEWASHRELATVPPADRLPQLLTHLAMAEPPADLGLLLDLAAMPMLVLRRPRGLGEVEDDARRLVEAAACRADTT